jgi:hypothetical protein
LLIKRPRLSADADYRSAWAALTGTAHAHRRRVSPRCDPTKTALKESALTGLTLAIAGKILDAALAKAVEKNLKPVVVAVLDARCLP